MPKKSSGSRPTKVSAVTIQIPCGPKLFRATPAPTMCARWFAVRAGVCSPARTRASTAMMVRRPGRLCLRSAGELFTRSAKTNQVECWWLPPVGCSCHRQRAISNVGGVTYIATYGYGVEKLQGSQRALIWPEANSDSRLRELTSLGQDANGRLLIGTASAGIFIFDGKQRTTER